MEFAIFNAAGRVRTVVKDGKTWFVAPMVGIVPGVLNGSKGALYYPEDEIQAGLSRWDGIPICVGHPTDPLTNIHLSAKERPDLNIGYIADTAWDGRQTHVGWFDAEKTKQVSPSIHDALKHSKPMELSTGLFTSNEPGKGQFNGKSYDFTARNYRPDHMAILPNQIGACGIKDGCGLNVNESVANKEETMSKSILERFMDWFSVNAWVQGRDSSGQFASHGSGTGKGATHDAAKKGASHDGGGDDGMGDPNKDKKDDEDKDKSDKLARLQQLLGNVLKKCPQCDGKMKDGKCDCGFTENCKAGTLKARWITYNRDWPQEKRDKLDSKDFAGPDQSFPISTQEDLDAAASSIGRTKHDPKLIKAGIKRIAKSKNLTLPESWEEDGTENANPEGINQYTRGDKVMYKGEEHEYLRPHPFAGRSFLRHPMEGQVTALDTDLSKSHGDAQTKKSIQQEPVKSSVAKTTKDESVGGGFSRSSEKGPIGKGIHYKSKNGDSIEVDHSVDYAKKGNLRTGVEKHVTTVYHNGKIVHEVGPISGGSDANKGAKLGSRTGREAREKAQTGAAKFLKKTFGIDHPVDKATNNSNTCPKCGGSMRRNLCEDCGYVDGEFSETDSTPSVERGVKPGLERETNPMGRVRNSNPDGYNQWSSGLKTATNKAEDASSEADDKEGHENAADLHRKAASMHSIAGNTDQAKEHLDSADYHDKRVSATHNRNRGGKMVRNAELPKKIGSALASMKDSEHEGTCDAVEASNKADESGKDSDHKAAAVAHLEAAKEHEKAGRDGMANKHQMIAEHHEGMVSNVKKKKNFRDLANNCSCEKTRIALNAMADDDDDDDDEDEDDEDEPVGKSKKSRQRNDKEMHSFDDGPVQGGTIQAGGKGTKDEYPNNRLVPIEQRLTEEEREVFNYARKAVEADKKKLVWRLVANILDPKRRNERGNQLMRNSLAELNELVELLPPVNNYHQRQQESLFLGMGGGPSQQVQNADASDESMILGLPTINWEEPLEDEEKGLKRKASGRRG